MTEQKPPGSGSSEAPGTGLVKEMMFQSINRMLVPTIIEPSGGGFIVLVNGKMHACTTLQEAFDYAAAHAEELFSQKIQAPPWNNLPPIHDEEGWLSRAKRMVTGTASAWLLLGAGIAVGFVLSISEQGGNLDQRNTSDHAIYRGEKEPQGYTMGRLDGADGASGPARQHSVSEVDVRRVRTESYVKPGE